jgi:hypothetical protein
VLSLCCLFVSFVFLFSIFVFIYCRLGYSSLKSDQSFLLALGKALKRFWKTKDSELLWIVLKALTRLDYSYDTVSPKIRDTLLQMTMKYEYNNQRVSYHYHIINLFLVVL